VQESISTGPRRERGRPPVTPDCRRDIVQSAMTITVWLEPYRPPPAAAAAVSHSMYSTEHLLMDGASRNSAPFRVSCIIRSVERAPERRLNTNSLSIVVDHAQMCGRPPDCLSGTIRARLGFSDWREPGWPHSHVRNVSVRQYLSIFQ